MKIFIYSLMNFDLQCSRHHIQTIAHVPLLLFQSIKTLILLVSFHLQCGENISYLSDPEITSCIFWRVLFITSFFLKKRSGFENMIPQTLSILVNKNISYKTPLTIICKFVFLEQWPVKIITFCFHSLYFYLIEH